MIHYLLSKILLLYLVAFYLGALAYVAAPALGVTIDTASIISAATAAPFALKFAAKTTVAAPFVFHCLNGVRHLVSFECLIIYIGPNNNAGEIIGLGCYQDA